MSEEAGNDHDKSGAGEGDNTFLDSLGEGNKGNDLFKDVESAEQLGTKFLEAHTSLEELRASQPVTPENVEGYTYDFGKDAQVNEEGIKAFKEVALASKMSPEAYKAVVKFDQDRIAAQDEEYKALAETAKTEMVKEMGDKYDENLQFAQKVLRAGGGDKLVEDVDLGNNPEFFKFLIGIGKMISEDKLEAPGESKGGSGGGEKDAAEVLFGDGLSGSDKA